MPIIVNPALSILFARSAVAVLARVGVPSAAAQLRVNSPLYRYVNYRNQAAQLNEAGRTQYRSLLADSTNRWTGLDAGGGGRQGLYFSAEFLNTGDPFPELTHYQAGPDVDSRATVSYYRYSAGLEPTLQTTEVTNLRSMFLFTLTSPLDGVDLRLRTDGGVLNPLLSEILEHAQADPEFSHLQAAERDLDLSNLEAVYRAPRADFCRPIGNVLLAQPGVDFLQVTSVRDGESPNIVIRTEVRNDGDPVRVLDVLRPQGRATFFVDGQGRVGNGVFTIADLTYNAAFESPAEPPRGLPPVAEVTARLVEVQQTMVDALEARVQEAIEANPGSNALDGVVDAVGALQDRLSDSPDPAGASDAIEALRTEIRQASDVAPDQFESVLSLSEGVATSLGTMSDAVRAGQDPQAQPPDSIEDPDPGDLDATDAPDATELGGSHD